MGCFIESFQCQSWEERCFNNTSSRYDNPIVVNVSRRFHFSLIFLPIPQNSDVITCIALDNCGSYLVTGSKDCTLIVWSLITTGVNIPSTNTSASSSLGQVNTTNSLTPRPIHTLYGHDDTISCVSIMTELDLVVSGSVVSYLNDFALFVVRR